MDQTLMQTEWFTPIPLITCSIFIQFYHNFLYLLNSNLILCNQSSTSSYIHYLGKCTFMSCLYYNICERILQTHHKIRCERNEEFIPKTSNSNVFTNAFYRKELHLNYYFVMCHVYRNKSNISIIALMFCSICTICNDHRTI